MSLGLGPPSYLYLVSCYSTCETPNSGRTLSLAGCSPVTHHGLLRYIHTCLPPSLPCPAGNSATRQLFVVYSLLMTQVRKKLGPCDLALLAWWGAGEGEKLGNNDKGRWGEHGEGTKQWSGL